MIWLIPCLAAEAPAEAAPAPTVAHLVAVFEEEPSDKARGKVIRHAMRKSKHVIGGRDWGRAICFQFDGEPDATVIQKAAAKAGLKAALRPVDSCMVPPQEALAPAKPALTLAVRMPDEVAPAEIRNGLTRLLGVGGLGLIGVRTLDKPADTFCMDFAAPPDPSVLAFLLESLPFETSSTEEVKECRDAFLAGKKSAE